MKIFIYGLMLLMSLGGYCQAAESTDSHQDAKTETAAFGLGALLGGLVGGPPGAIVGAVGSTLFANQQNTKKQELVTLKTRLEQRDVEFFKLRQQFIAIQSEYENNLQQVNLKQERSAGRLSKGVSYSVYFRTNESVPDARLQPHFADLVALIRDMPTVKVILEGYADRRGNEQYNMTLSKARVNSIRDELVHAGLPSNRIILHAHGESDAKQNIKDYEGLVFDRRVDLKLTVSDEV